MTIVEALKALYVAFGGDEDDVAGITEIAEMIEALATVAADVAGATLPEVDSEDNGKVLKVIEGEWGLGTDETTTG